jgi:ABC-type Fe3+-hydroxamate transport system substrate-binding protein
MKSITLTVMLVVVVVVLSACGRSAETSSTNSSNSTSANSSNSSSSSSSSSPELTKKDSEPKDTTPLTMTVSDIVGNYDESKDGRMVTVTGGLLEEMKRDSLLIRNGASSAFYCYGDFSQYMDGAPKIDSLRQQQKSPVATVKGIYKKGNGYGADLGPCVLMDLGK